MIKNWTVKTAQIKRKRKTKSGKTLKSSAMKYCKYLLNEKANSHHKTTIIELKKNASSICEIERQIHERKIFRQATGLRGGGFNSEATSFVLSLPKDVYQPTDNEWAVIAAKAVEELSNVTGVPVKDLWKQSVVVLHKEGSKNKNNHLNLCIGNIYNNDYIKSLTQLKSTYAVKQSFNKSMLSLGVDHKEYEAKKPNRGNKPLFAAREEKAMEMATENERNAAANKREKERLSMLKTLLKKIAESFDKYVKNITEKCLKQAEVEADRLAETVINTAEIAPEIAKEKNELFVKYEKAEKVDFYQKSIKKQTSARKRRKRTRKDDKTKPNQSK